MHETESIQNLKPLIREIREHSEGINQKNQNSVQMIHDQSD